MLTKEDLIVGHVYSAKKKRIIGLFTRYYNDRAIIRKLAGGAIQYDSPTIKVGRHYPKNTEEQFLKWAKEDITNITPEDDWRKAE